MEKHLSKLAVGALIVALVGITCLSLAGILYPDRFVALGAWGDFFGGVANPLLTFLTFGAVLITLWLQQQELGLTRKELSRSASALESQIDVTKKQRDENTFFQLLSLHNEVVNSIDLQSKGKPTQYGRDCFNTFYTRITKIYREIEENKNIPKNERIDRAYKRFWNTHQPELGHYYRILFRCFIFSTKTFPLNDFYVSLLRAQLSDQELLMLFYNALTPQGSAFKAIIEEWALFDNMPRLKLLEHKHEELFARTAYDSDLARAKRIEEPLGKLS